MFDDTHPQTLVDITYSSPPIRFQLIRSHQEYFILRINDSEYKIPITLFFLILRDFKRVERHLFSTMT